MVKVFEGNLNWSPPRLETERLILRGLSVEDAASIFEYAKNPNVSRYTLWEPHRSVKDSESYILDYAMPHYRSQTPEPWGITLKSNPQKVVGTVGVFWVSKANKAMEIACALGEEFWGQGLAVESLQAAIQFCWSAFDVVRIQGRSKVENVASLRVMEKLGFSFEGTLRSSVFHRGRSWDLKVYSVLRPQGGG